jgi:glutaminyl-tRNA synthetase
VRSRARGIDARRRLIKFARLFSGFPDGSRSVQLELHSPERRRGPRRRHLQDGADALPARANGYLHFDHVKSICLNFAEQYGGRCNLRFNDTNPEKEEQEYVDSIKDGVKWLGFASADPRG